MANAVPGRLFQLTRKHFPALLASAVAICSIGLAMRALHASRKAQDAAKAAIEDRDLARTSAAEFKQQLDQMEVARQAAEAERDQALAAKQTAERLDEDQQAVLDFLRDNLLSAGSPKEWTGRSRTKITLREAVDAAEPQVNAAFAGRPLAEAITRSTLGWTYFYLGEAELAAKQYERALALREATLDPDDPMTIGSRNDLARAYRAAGRADDASKLYDQDPQSPSHAAAPAKKP